MSQVHEKQKTQIQNAVTQNAGIQLIDDTAITQNAGTQLIDDTVMQHVDAQLEDEIIPQRSPVKRKRQSRKCLTPVVDDMVRRSIRKHKPEGFRHIHLDFVKGQRGPRETPISPILEDQLQGIEEAAAMDDEAMIPIEAMQDLATQFCAVPPEEVSDDVLLNNHPSNE
jgi:hypothetical protein